MIERFGSWWSALLPAMFKSSVLWWTRRRFLLFLRVETTVVMWRLSSGCNFVVLLGYFELFVDCLPVRSLLVLYGGLCDFKFSGYSRSVTSCTPIRDRYLEGLSNRSSSDCLPMLLFARMNCRFYFCSTLRASCTFNDIWSPVIGYFFYAVFVSIWKAGEQ